MIHIVIMVRVGAIFAGLLVLAQVAGVSLGQTGANSRGAGAGIGANNSPAAASRPAASSTSAASPKVESGCNGGPCDHPQPHISVANPPLLPPSWAWYDRIAWGASLVLTFVGYLGVMVALGSLRNIERQTRSAEAVAQAAVASANAALSSVQSMIGAERPWISVAVEPSIEMENSFKVVAMNRGRGPAEIVATSGKMEIAKNESYLAKPPAYSKDESVTLAVPIILLPGEFTVIQPFGRDDVQWVCKSDDSIHRVELWQDYIFLHGRIVYRDLNAPDGKQSHETAWCCRYIHGENRSDLVMAGPREYNTHT